MNKYGKVNVPYGVKKRLVYVVFEDIDVDGGYGDAISTIEPVIAFLSKEKADKYVSDNSNPVEYDHPYDALYEGGLHVEEVPMGEE